MLVARLRHVEDPGTIADELLDRFSPTDAAAPKVPTYFGLTARPVQRGHELGLAIAGESAGAHGLASDHLSEFPPEHLVRRVEEKRRNDPQPTSEAGMTAQLEMTDLAQRFADAIVVTGLRKSFGATLVLDGIDLTVGRGTVFALLGANGSGKTTTINILTTLINADSGTASVAGFDVAEQASEVREQISVTGQFAAVDHLLTARENLVLMGELRHVADPRQTAADLLDTFDLNEAADRRLLTFSGGMRRRLDIAMSLVGDPPIIFFDEPTTGLDPKSRTDMYLTIRQLVEKGTTVFLTTQYLEEADRLADEIAILHGGRIVAGGTPDELKAMVPTGLVELEFGDEEQLLAAQRALGEQHEVSRADSKLVVATTGSVAEMADIFIRLKDSGIEPTGFSRQLPTLDDVFFKILDDDKEDRHASAH